MEFNWLGVFSRIRFVWKNGRTWSDGVHVQQELGKLTEQEDGNLTRMVAESLKHEKEMIEEMPNMVLHERTKELRQMCFKERFKRRQVIMAHGT
jgi:hypothetical protein